MKLFRKENTLQLRNIFNIMRKIIVFSQMMSI